MAGTKAAAAGGGAELGDEEEEGGANEEERTPPHPIYAKRWPPSEEEHTPPPAGQCVEFRGPQNGFPVANLLAVLFRAHELTQSVLDPREQTLAAHGVAVSEGSRVMLKTDCAMRDNAFDLVSHDKSQVSHFAVKSTS